LSRQPPTLDADFFAVALTRAAGAAAMSFGYDEPPLADVAAWLSRLPLGTRDRIGHGIRAGLIEDIPGTGMFTLSSLGASKGPYAWFSRNRLPRRPSPNWEYFYQVAEFVRIRESVDPSLAVGFEDGLMDVSVRNGTELLWYVEVKAAERQIEPLLTALKRYGATVPVTEPDRGNDPLRKAKYLVRHRPPYLSVVGGERRRHFQVRYEEPATFEIREIQASPETRLNTRDQ
jgi:hypothetical protein